MDTKFNIEELVDKGRSGDHSSFRSIYDRYVLDMLSTSYNIINEMAEAEDVVQEAFVKSFQKIDSLQDKSSYRAWLKRIVINASLGRVRKRIRWEELGDQDYEVDDGADRWYESISMSQINDAINGLPNGCRQVLVLYLLEEYKHKEVASLLNISVSTSKSQYRYALHLLKQMLINKYLK